jgi:histidinol-phosphatase
MFEREAAFAREVLAEAAEVGLRWFRADDLEVRTKTDDTPVTAADLEIEALVRRRLDEAFPDDRILGEEEGGSHDPGGRVWILDPIDGTYHFARGIPIWATLLALYVDGTGVLGAAGAPALGETYAATREGGATLNDDPIHVSEIADVTEAFLQHAATETFLRDPAWRGWLDTMAAAPRNRAVGDFWGHLLVAHGAAEAMLEPELNLWDFAALRVIVEEAGGRMTQADGSPVAHRRSVLTSNGALHDELIRRIAQR